jgi:hypothetical protein
MSLNTVLSRLDTIQNGLESNLHSALMISMLTLVETPAKQKLTIDRHVVTGRLRSSLRSEVNKNGETMQGRTFTNVIYAKKIEFRHDSYLLWAFDTHKNDILNKLASAGRSAIS